MTSPLETIAAKVLGERFAYTPALAHHLAAEIARAVAEDEGLRAVVVAALNAEGAEPGNSLHSWRCEHPDRYGPCDCVAETAASVIDALTREEDR